LLFAFLVIKEGNVIGIINVTIKVLANLNTKLGTDIVHDEVHGSAKQGGSQNAPLPHP